MPDTSIVQGFIPSIKLLSLFSAVIYLPLMVIIYKKKKSLYPLLTCLSLSALCIWQYYGLATINLKDQGTIGPFAGYFKKGAYILPIIALLTFLGQRLADPGKKISFTKGLPIQHLWIKALRAAPASLVKLGITLYTIIIFLSLGLIIGLFVAEIHSFVSIWFIVIHILGAIAIGWVLVSIFIHYQTAKVTLAQEQRKEKGATATAHIDQIKFGGVRLMETHQLMLFQLTVYPKIGTPYLTSIRQYLTQEQLAIIENAAYVQFYEDPLKKTKGVIIIDSKADTVQPPTVHSTQVAFNTYTQLADNRHIEPDNVLISIMGKSKNIAFKAVHLLAILALFMIGFLAPFKLTGNMDWLRIRLKYYPQKFTFQYKGNFNEDAFKMAYDKAIAYIGDQKIESLLFYKDFTHITYEPANHPGYCQMVDITGNTASKIFSPMSIHEPERLFTASSLSYERFKKAMAAADKTGKIKDIMYIGARSDGRHSVTPSPNRLRQRGLTRAEVQQEVQQQIKAFEAVASQEPPVYLHVVFEGGDKSFRY